MPPYGRRIHEAFTEYMAITGQPNLTLAWLGKQVAMNEVGKAGGPRRTAYSAATVSSWVWGRTEPTLAVFEALARVLRIVSAAELAFGGDNLQPMISVRGKEGRSALQDLIRQRAALPISVARAVDSLVKGMPTAETAKEAYAIICSYFIATSFRRIALEHGQSIRQTTMSETVSAVAHWLGSGESAVEVERRAFYVFEEVVEETNGEYDPEVYDSTHWDEIVHSFRQYVVLSFDEEERKESTVWAPPYLVMGHLPIDVAFGSSVADTERPIVPVLSDYAATVLSGLPKVVRRAFLMHDIAGTSVREVAAEIGESEAETRTHLEHARVFIDQIWNRKIRGFPTKLEPVVTLGERGRRRVAQLYAADRRKLPGPVLHALQTLDSAEPVPIERGREAYAVVLEHELRAIAHRHRRSGKVAATTFDEAIRETRALLNGADSMADVERYVFAILEVVEEHVMSRTMDSLSDYIAAIEAISPAAEEAIVSPNEDEPWVWAAPFLVADPRAQEDGTL